MTQALRQENHLILYSYVLFFLNKYPAAEVTVIKVKLVFYHLLITAGPMTHFFYHWRIFSFSLERATVLLGGLNRLI